MRGLIVAEATYAGGGAHPVNGFGPQEPHQPNAGSLISNIRSILSYRLAEPWRQNSFLPDRWYRIDTKLNVRDTQNNLISVWPDECIYQIVYLPHNSDGYRHLRIGSNPIIPIGN